MTVLLEVASEMIKIFSLVEFLNKITDASYTRLLHLIINNLFSYRYSYEYIQVQTQFFASRGIYWAFEVLRTACQKRAIIGQIYI